MPTHFRYLTDVTDELLPEIVLSYYRDGALRVVPKPVASGIWQITAEFAGEEIPALSARRTATS